MGLAAAGSRAQFLYDMRPCRAESLFGFGDDSRDDVTGLRHVLDKARSFAGENHRGIHVAGGRPFLIARSLAGECKRQLALVTMPPFGEIVAQRGR